MARRAAIRRQDKTMGKLTARASIRVRLGDGGIIVSGQYGTNPLLQ